MAGNANWDAILTTTLNNYRGTLVDNAFSSQVFVAWLKRKDHVKLIDGGAKIIVELMYGANSTAASYSGYDTLAVTAQTGISAAEYSWGQYYATVAINGLEEAQNSGPAKIESLLDAKIKQAEMSISENMDVMFLKDGTGNSSKDWNGLDVLVGDENDAITSVGGIDCATTGNEFWRSYVDTPATDTVLSLADMRTAYNTASKGNEHPDLGLTAQDLFEAYEGLVQPQQRFSDSTTADAGFQNLLFKRMVLMFDENLVEATKTGFGKRMYFLNSKYIWLNGDKDRWFVNTPFVRPHTVDARYSQIIAHGEMVISNRKCQGRLDKRIAS
jgi:hypothetical protein